MKDAATTHLIQALALPEDDGDSLPREIQWMPPGRHEIRASKNGKPSVLTVDVDESVARRVEASFRDMTGKGRRPYLDFNHAGGAAAGRVTAVRWGGDDPILGGVRVAVDWSAEGAAAVKGRAYGFFSPSFLVDASGKVSGSTVNMGGLVNEPAFTAIAPVSASETQTHATMTKLLAALVAAKLIPSADLDDEAAASAVTASHKALSDRVTASESRVTTLEGEVKAAAKTRAEGIVDAAAREGRIPPKDTKTREYWVNSIVTAGAPAEDALKALPVNPALGVQAREHKSREAGSADFVAEQNKAIDEYRAKHAGCTYEQAYTACASANPELFSK